MATVTIKEAAQSLGVSQDTVRRRIRKKELQARQTPTPQGFRWAVELGPDDTNDTKPDIHANDGNHGDLVEILRQELAEKNRQISELHRLLAQTALNAAPGRPWWAFWR